MTKLENYQKPQKKDEFINRWESDVVRAYYFNPKVDMWEYLETSLVESVSLVYFAVKRDYYNDIEKVKNLGNNPYNFTAFIWQWVLGNYPFRGYTSIQDQAISDLEKLQIKHWKYINEFLKDYFNLVARSGCPFDFNIRERLFLKLPINFGKEINEEFKKEYDQTKIIPLGIAIQFILKYLKKKCQDIEITRTLKKESYGFCQNIFTVQQYGYRERKKSQKAKFKRKHKLRKSGTFVGKKKSCYVKRPSKSKGHCFICGDPSHIAKNCKNKERNPK